MPQKPWPAWFISNVAAALTLLVWAASALPPHSLGLYRGAWFGALEGAALVVGTQVGPRWARNGRVRVSLLPMCLLAATTAAAATGVVGGQALGADIDTSGASLANDAVLSLAALAAAVGQACLFVALVHPETPSAAARPSAAREPGPALAMQLAACCVAACVYHASGMLHRPATWLLGSAAGLWLVAAALFASGRPAPAPATPAHAATVSMASILRHRRWPLLGVAAICGSLMACTPTLWVQSLQCVSGLQAPDALAPILMLAGCGLGAKVATSAARRPATVRLALAITLLSCAGFFLLGIIHFNSLPHRLQALLPGVAVQPVHRTLLEVLLLAMVVLPVSVSTGACLPLVAAAVNNGAPAATHSTRMLRIWGLGMVVGAALVPVLARWVGLEATMRAAALLYTFAALVSSSAATPERKVVVSLDVAALALALAIAVWPRWTVQDVEWAAQAGGRDAGLPGGLHYLPTLDNMRGPLSRSDLPEDHGSSS